MQVTTATLPANEIQISASCGIENIKRVLNQYTCGSVDERADCLTYGPSHILPADERDALYELMSQLEEKCTPEDALALDALHVLLMSMELIAAQTEQVEAV